MPLFHRGGGCCEDLRTESAGPVSGLCCRQDSGNACSCSVSGGAGQGSGWGAPEHSLHSRVPWTPACRAWLPVLCVTLVTLGSCCLGFPTCWAEIGLLAESARVFNATGLGRRLGTRLGCHGFSKGQRGRQPVPAQHPHSSSDQLFQLRFKCGCLKGPISGLSQE